MEKQYKAIFGFWAIAFALICAPLRSQTPAGANGVVFRFTKQVWLNPSIVLAKQNFEQSTNVKLLILPRLNSNDTVGNSKIEKAFDMLLSFLVFKENVQGSIKFYFNPKNPYKPFTFNTSEELKCKFTPVQRDSVETILNKDIINSNNLNNFTALPFDSIINRASRYCKKVLQSRPGPCGDPGSSDFTLTKINSTPAKLNFEKGVPLNPTAPNGGVDKKQYGELEQYYNVVLDVADNSNYPLAWKAMTATGNDVIKLKLKKKDPGFDLSRVVFKNANGTETYNVSYSHVNSDSTIDLGISGKSPGSMAEVVAYYTPTTTPTQTFVIGAFNVQFYEPKPMKVVLVSLSNTAIPPAYVAAVTSTLNEVYSSVFVKWTVETATCPLPNGMNKAIHVQSSGLLSNYMPDMQDIVSHFKDNCTAYKSSEANTYYLLYGCTNDGNLAGYMPRARNTGFIFDTDARTAAHELGHGAFNLKHIFSSDELGEGNKTRTDNVMDYAGNSPNGKQLEIYKHQWDNIHNPGFVGWFEGDDEEGAEIAGGNCNENNVPTNLRALAERAKQCDNNVSIEAEAYTESLFATLCINQRINLIKCILKNTWVDGDDEATIIRLIKSTPNDQIALLFANLSMNNNQLLTILMSKLNNAFGADNYTQFFLEINTLFSKVNKRKDNPLFYWGVSTEPTIKSGSMLSVSLNNGKVTIQGNYSFKYISPNDLTPIDYIRVDTTLNIFEPISLTYFAAPSQANVGSITVGETYVVPAIFLKFIYDNVWNGIMENVTYDVIDLAGSGAAITKIRFAKKLANIFNIGITSINSINFIIKSPAVRQSLISNGHGEFLFYWERSVALANVAYLSPHAYKFFSGFVSRFRSAKPALQSQLSQTQINELENTATKLEQEITGSGNIIGNWMSSFPLLASKLNSWKNLELIFEQVDDYVRILSKNGDEIAVVIKNGSDEVIEISDDLFKASGSNSTPITGMIVKTSTGEAIIGGGFVKNANGTISFVEDVTSYGNSVVQSTIKNRGALRGFLTGILATEDAHHVIPVQLLKENEVVKKAVEAGFSFNTSKNGLAIQKFVKATGIGRHGPHPNYTNQIRVALNRFKTQNPNFTNQQAKDFLDALTDDIKNTINTTTGKINDLNLGL